MRTSLKTIPYLATPMIIANITVPLLGAVDTAVLGYLAHPAYLAGASVATNMFSFLFGVCLFLRMTTTGYTAQAHGKKNWTDVQAQLTYALLTGAILGIGLWVLSPIFYSFLLPFLVGVEEVTSLSEQYLILTHAQSYTIWRFIGAPITLMNMGLIGWFIGLQRVRTALYLQLFQNGLNIALDLLFVHYWQQDVAGVAQATLLSEILTFLISLIYIKTLFRHTHHSWLPIGLYKLKSWSHLFQTNRDLFIRSFLLMASMMAMTAISAREGSVFLASNAILLNLFLFASYALDGFAHAAEIQVGYAFGQKHLPSLKKAIKESFLWAFVFAFFLALLIGLGGWLWIALLTPLAEVRALAYVFLPWAILSPLIGAPAFILDGIFIGATQTLYLRNAMLYAIVLYVPCLFLFSFLWGPHGIWCAFSLLLAARTLFLYPALKILPPKLLS